MNKTADELIESRAKELGVDTEEYKRYLINTAESFQNLNRLQVRFARGVAEESENRADVIMVLNGIIDALKQQVESERKRRRFFEQLAGELKMELNNIALNEIGHGA